jgi:hypothetical protein
MFLLCERSNGESTILENRTVRRLKKYFGESRKDRVKVLLSTWKIEYAGNCNKDNQSNKKAVRIKWLWSRSSQR